MPETITTPATTTAPTPPEPIAQPSSAAGWARWHDWTAANMQPLSDWFGDATALAPGMRVLDIASGTGVPAHALAARVRPSGTVVASDISAEMLAAAERKARALGLDNLEFRVLDAQKLDFPDASFDAVTCSFGLMFCPDPPKAVAEMLRVLKPGGRVAVAVWTEPEHNPFFTTVFGTVAQFMPKAPMPPPDAPGMFKLGAPGALDAVLRAGGLRDFTIAPMPLVMRLESLEQHWQMFSEMAPPVVTAPEYAASVRAHPPARNARANTAALPRARSSGAARDAAVRARNTSLAARPSRNSRIFRRRPAAASRTADRRSPSQASLWPRVTVDSAVCAAVGAGLGCG